MAVQTMRNDPGALLAWVVLRAMYWAGQPVAVGTVIQATRHDAMAHVSAAKLGPAPAAVAPVKSKAKAEA